MRKPRKESSSRSTEQFRPLRNLLRVCRSGALLLVVGAVAGLCSCGSSNKSNSQVVAQNLSGNWQFNMAQQLNSDPTKPSFTGGLRGGFLAQNNNSIAGQANFLIMTQPVAGSGAVATPCNSGTDQITGTISGQTVNLTAQSSTGQTFTLTGTLSLDSSTMTGSYISTDGAGCGIATSQNWSATLVPQLAGTLQGVLRSTGGTAGLSRQEFVVSGTISQAQNTGANSASITGNLSFMDPVTLITDYPCLASVSVTGQISGNTVFLQLVAADGSTVGQIGQAAPTGLTGVQPVTFDSTGSGSVLESLTGNGYAVFAPQCGGGTLPSPADTGSICIGVGTTAACQPPIILAPTALGFPSQAIGSAKSTLQVTLSNPSHSILNGITLTLNNDSGPGNFTEADNCGVNGTPSQGQPFSLVEKQFCIVNIGFSPKQSCPGGTSPGQCLTGMLTVTSPSINSILNVPLIGGVTGEAASSSLENF